MTPEQKASYIFAQAVCAMVEIEAMKAENKYREMRQETIAYDEHSFMAVIEEHGIHHNAILKFFQE
jgi:hypothetical protein